MEQSLRAKIEALQLLNLTLRHQLEAVELHIAPINDAIRQLHGIARLPELLLPGQLIGSNPYATPYPIDRGQVLQAALDVPRGIGLVRWDYEEVAVINAPPDELSAAMMTQFVTFDELSSAEKAQLLPAIDGLLNQLFEALRLGSD